MAISEEMFKSIENGDKEEVLSFEDLQNRIQEPVQEEPLAEVVTDPVEPVAEANPDDVIGGKETPAVEEFTPDKWDEFYNQTEYAKENQKKQDLAKYEAQMKKIQEFEESEIYKVWSLAKEKNIDFDSAYKEYVPSDISDLKPVDLYKKQLEAIKGDMTEEQYEQAIERFEDLPIEEQLLKTKPVKEQLLNERKEKLSNLTPKSSEKTVEYTPEEIANAKQAINELRSTLLSLRGKNIDGVDYTSERVVKIHDLAQKILGNTDILPLGDSGKFNTSKAVEIANMILFGDLVKKGERESGKAEGMREALRAKHNPSAGAVETRMPKESSRAAKWDEAAAKFAAG